jgi:hypothetical protein
MASDGTAEGLVMVRVSCVIGAVTLGSPWVLCENCDTRSR